MRGPRPFYSSYQLGDPLCPHGKLVIQFADCRECAEKFFVQVDDLAEALLAVKEWGFQRVYECKETFPDSLIDQIVAALKPCGG